MKQSRAKLAQMVADTTLKKGVSKHFSQEIAAYLLSEGRVNELDSLLRDVQADWAKTGYLEVIARSAYPLSAAVKRDIATRLKKLFPNATQVVITEQPDEQVIGGVRLNLPNQQLDLSIEAKLNKFRQLTAVGKDA